MTIAIIIGSIALIFLILYLGDFKFEFDLKTLNHKTVPEVDKTMLEKLSNTELNILKLVANGKTNQEIADELFVSVHTVKKHISNLFKKLRFTSRNEARKYKEFIQ